MAIRKVKVTERDKNILEGLSGYYLLSTKQIQSLYFQNINTRTVLRRLRLLRGQEYLRRFKFGVNGECVWSLGKKAEKILAKDIKIHGINRNSLEHDLKTNDLRIDLESKKIGSNFISGFCLRHQASANKSPYNRSPETIPDWIFSMRMTSGAKIIALECELNYKGKRRMHYVFERYYKKSSIHHLWYVVPTESFKRKLLKIYKEYPLKKSDNYLFVSTFSEFEKSLDEMIFSTIKADVSVKKICSAHAHRPEYRVGNLQKQGVA